MRSTYDNTVRRVQLVDDELALTFPYDKEEVAEVKQIPGARWDRLALVWRVPVVRLNEVRDFAKRRGLEVDTEVALLVLPKGKAPPETGVSLDGDWLYCSFAYDPVRVRSVKQIPGITWVRSTKAWKAPVSSISEVVEWARAFNQKVAEDVLVLHDEITSKQARALEASRLEDADITVGDIPLLPYQRAGVAYLVEHRRAFCADQQGLGKTITSIASLLHADREDQPSFPAAVICPPKLVLNWAKEFSMWAPDLDVAVVTGRKVEWPESYDVVVLGYSNLSHWESRLMGHRALVFDESHYLKTPTAQRTKSAVKISKSVPADGMVICLTGTPITNRPAEYAPQLEVLGHLKSLGGKWGFYRRYCGAFRDRWGQWHIDGHSNLGELNDKLRATGCYIRRTKEQVMSELPPVRHAPLLVEGTPSRMKEYAKAEADIVEYLVQRAREIAEELGTSPGRAEVHARMAAESAEHLVRMATLRRLAAWAKMDAIEEWVEQHLEADEKVVLAAHHRDVVEHLALTFGAQRIMGGMSVKEVESEKAKFMTLRDARVMVLSIQAAKEGHTLTAAQDIGFVELPFTPSDVDQTYSRLHRIGQEGSVTSTYLLAPGTIDMDIYDMIEQKRAVVDAATEGGEVALGSVAKALTAKFLQKGLDLEE